MRRADHRKNWLDWKRQSNSIDNFFGNAGIVHACGIIIQLCFLKCVIQTPDVQSLTISYNICDKLHNVDLIDCLKYVLVGKTVDVPVFR